MSDLTVFNPSLNVFDTNFLETLDLSNETLPPIQGESTRDPNWRAHRKLDISEGRFCWTIPTSNEEKEKNGGTEYSDFPNKYPERLVSLRGIPVFYPDGSFSKHGFLLYDGIEKKVVCKTTKVEMVSNTGEIVEHDAIPFPIRSPHQSREKNTTVNNTLQKRSVYPYGSRPPVGNLESRTQVRSCAECVLAGENSITNGTSINYCGSTGEAMFLVVQLGFEDPTEYNQDSINGRCGLKWVNVQDLKLSYMDGNNNIHRLDRPFIAKIKVGGSMQLSTIGSDFLKIHYASDLTANGRPTEAARLATYPNEVYTWNDYTRYLRANKANYDMITPRDEEGNPMAPIPVCTRPTEIHLVQIKQSSNPKENLLMAFHPIEDETIINAGSNYTGRHWFQLGQQVYFYETSLAQGKMLENVNFIPLSPPNKNLALASSKPATPANNVFANSGSPFGN
jgi:hypothetical protein